MGGSSGSGNATNTVRFAQYLEDIHWQYLNRASNAVLHRPGSVIDILDGLQGQSPYGNYEQVDIDKGFLGLRSDDTSLTYEIENYPSLWAIFGEFMSGLDICDLWGEVYENLVHGPEIENAVSAHVQILQDEVDTKILPSFMAGMRDINAVQSSTFVIGKAIINETVVREANKFSSELRFRALDASAKVWSRHLDWSASVVTTYSELMKLYYVARMDTDKLNFEMQAKDLLWDMNLFDYLRAFLGALNGAPAAVSHGEQPKGNSAIGNTLSGAAAGYMVAGPWGAAAGAALGLATSFL